MNLHIGCGDKRIEGYLNIDVVKTSATDMVSDTMQLPFDECSVDKIYACSMLEHFGRNDTMKFFRNTCWTDVVKYWYGLLKQDGILYISVPDFKAICQHYLETERIEDILGLVVGGQKNEEDLHGMVFDMNYLKKRLEAIGFRKIEKYDWKSFEAFQDSDYDDYSASYIPHKDFDRGRLMMLNLKVTK